MVWEDGGGDPTSYPIGYARRVGIPPGLPTVAVATRATAAQTPAAPARFFETGIVGFIHNQDPAVAAYRYLARAPSAAAAWPPDRGYWYVAPPVRRPGQDTAAGD